MGLWYWMMWMFWVFLAIVCAMWCGTIADSKGYSRVLFTVLGFFFLIFTLIVVAILPTRQRAAACPTLNWASFAKESRMDAVAAAVAASPGPSGARGTAS